MSRHDEASRVRQESAETLALQVLAWLASDGQRLGAFLAASGLTAAALSQEAATPALLGGVMDHLMSDDSLVRACAADLGIAPERFDPARQALPGGAVPHWT